MLTCMRDLATISRGAKYTVLAASKIPKTTAGDMMIGSLEPSLNPMTFTLTETSANIVKFISNGMYVFDKGFNTEDQLVTEIKHNSKNGSLPRLEPLFLASNDKFSFL
jgi:hypothetical protein